MPTETPPQVTPAASFDFGSAVPVSETSHSFTTETPPMPTANSSYDAPSSPKKRGLSYPFVGLILLVAAIVLAGQHYGLGDILPYPLSGLIAAGFVALVALWLLASGRLGKLLSVLLGIVVLGGIGLLIADTVSPGLLPKTGEWGLIAGYDQSPDSLGFHISLQDTAAMATQKTITNVEPTTPDSETLSGTTVLSGESKSLSGGNDSLSGYTIKEVKAKKPKS